MLKVFIFSVTLLYDHFFFRCTTESPCFPSERKFRKAITQTTLDSKFSYLTIGKYNTYISLVR